MTVTPDLRAILPASVIEQAETWLTADTPDSTPLNDGTTVADWRRLGRALASVGADPMSGKRLSQRAPSSVTPDLRAAHSDSPLGPEHQWSGPSDLATCVVCNLPRRPTRRASDVGGSRCPECYRHLGMIGMRPHLRPDDFEPCAAGIDELFPATDDRRAALRDALLAIYRSRDVFDGFDKRAVEAADRDVDDLLDALASVTPSEPTLDAEDWTLLSSLGAALFEQFGTGADSDYIRRDELREWMARWLASIRTERRVKADPDIPQWEERRGLS